MNDSRPPKPKRRWFQFSLRTLLVFVLLVSVPLGWFAMKMQRARQQKEAVEVILKVGGEVRYDYEFDETGRLIPAAQPAGPLWLRKLLGDDFFCDVIWVDLSATRVTDAGVEHLLKGLTSLEVLWLMDTNVTDVGLEHLQGLNSLNSLGLSGTQLTDAGLEHLESLTSLEHLGLHETSVTGEGFKHLKGLTSLVSLCLRFTNVTDAGLEHLKGLTNLACLDLRSTQVTDDGLENLKGLNCLESLGLAETDVTHEGVQRLQEALPNCYIHRRR